MNYYKIEKNSISNGQGIRTVLWISGCSIHCEGCHNKETWNFSSGKEFKDEDFTYILNELKKPYVAGLTLSGGHPLELQNRKEVFNIVKKIKMIIPEKTIWLYTGWKWEDIIKIKEIYNIFKYCDVVVDGPFIKNLRDISLPYCGSSNQRVIDVKESLKENRVILLNKNSNK